MTIRLDATDRHLLALLQANAREHAALLARKLGIARSTVVARIARLERSEIIGGYTVRMNHAAKTPRVHAYCSLTVSAKRASAVIGALTRLPEVIEVCAVSGRYDYMVFLCCDTPQQLDELLDQVGQIDGVHQSHTALVLRYKLDRRSAQAC